DALHGALGVAAIRLRRRLLRRGHFWGHQHLAGPRRRTRVRCRQLGCRRLRLVGATLLRFLLPAFGSAGAVGHFLFLPQPRLFQLAYGVFALGLGIGRFGNDAALYIGALAAHFDIDGLRRGRGTAWAGSGDLELAHGTPPERDVARGALACRGVGVLVLVAAQEAKQLDLFGAADHLLLI